MNHRPARANARRGHDLSDDQAMGGTIEPRRRLAAQALAGFGETGRDRVQRTSDHW